MTKRIVRDDYHNETYLVDSLGRECCEFCGGPYEHLAGGWQHEDDCELLTPDNAPTTVVTDTVTVGDKGEHR